MSPESVPVWPVPARAFTPSAGAYTRRTQLGLWTDNEAADASHNAPRESHSRSALHCIALHCVMCYAPPLHDYVCFAHKRRMGHQPLLEAPEGRYPGGLL